MKGFPRIENGRLLRMLEYPHGKVDIVIDTDTANEIDDQFALVYALKSCDRFNVKAVYAAPFINAQVDSPKTGMEKSYDEILRMLGLLGLSGTDFAFKGSPEYLPDGENPVRSEAARDLAERAAAYSEEAPLYVVAIGAITNVASALLMNPEMVKSVVVVWLGGNPFYWHYAHEFNLVQDIPAARVLFDSGVPLVHIPCRGVASHLFTSLPELEYYLAGHGAVCDALLELFRNHWETGYGTAKEIWDLAPFAYLIDPSWVPSALVHSPILTSEKTWSLSDQRHLIRNAYYICRNPIFADLFAKLQRK